MVERVDHFYPIVRLHSFYHLPTEVTQMEDGILLWVEANDRSYCLFVDESDRRAAGGSKAASCFSQ